MISASRFRTVCQRAVRPCQSRDSVLDVWWLRRICVKPFSLRRTAYISGVKPRLSRCERSAPPFARIILKIFLSNFPMARERAWKTGVWPCRSSLLMSICSIAKRDRTTPAWPFFTAIPNGVTSRSRSAVLTWMSSRCNNILTTFSSPPDAAHQRAH